MESDDRKILFWDWVVKGKNGEKTGKNAFRKRVYFQIRIENLHLECGILGENLNELVLPYAVLIHKSTSSAENQPFCPNSQTTIWPIRAVGLNAPGHKYDKGFDTPGWCFYYF